MKIRPRLVGSGGCSSIFFVSELAQASIGAVGAAMASFIGTATSSDPPEVVVDRALSSAWFGASLRPIGWELPPAWDSVAGDYQGLDGWIRLHTNAPDHRLAVLEVLAAKEERAAVIQAVAHWSVNQLEEAIVAAGGASAAMRSLDQWRVHPQGRAVSSEPLLDAEKTNTSESDLVLTGLALGRPLQGVRILDLTRVLAGPVATRTLAGWGASVLRIDPPDWDEPGVIPEVMPGKRTARLDLRRNGDREVFLELLRTADVLVHGYRPGALDALGLGPEVRRQTRPGLVDVSLDAYGWTGPWKGRRGFDSLVQMSCGIADAGMNASPSDHPVPLPVQALDHATGYIIAAATISGLTQRLVEGSGSSWQTSLARIANLLIDGGTQSSDAESHGTELAISDEVEKTSWGNAHRLVAPIKVAGARFGWELPARRLGMDLAAW